MKKRKALIALLLAVILCVPFGMFSFAQPKDYEITDPYAGINWETINAYKTALHTHTNASDGDPTLKQSVQRHVETGFDIVATTDHGTVNYTWAEPCPNKLIHTVLTALGRNGQDGELEYLGNEGTFDSGVSYTYATADNGDDYLTTDDGRTVLRLPYGIENNAVSVNAHVNSWFADFCDNSVTNYEDAIEGVEKAGGLCVINHPGEYTKARYALTTAEAYDESVFAYSYYINKFAELIALNKSCIGIDINSKGDNRTRFERKLWDILLTRFSANGDNVFAIASSDAHQLGVIDTGFSLLLMDELTGEAARSALENGQFFAASHCIGNPDELADIAAALKEYYGETELYDKVNGSALALVEKARAITEGELDADEDLDITYSVLEDGFTTCSTFPSVNSITVNESKDTITIDASDALLIRWISGGKLIATQKADGTPFDLNDYESELGDYVRAEVFGEGGILYTQAFLLDATRRTTHTPVTKGLYFNMGILDFLFAELHKWDNIIFRFFSNVFTKR